MDEAERDLRRANIINSLRVSLKALGDYYPKFNDYPDHNEDTPRRIADMWIEMFEGLEEPSFKFTTFPNKGSEGMVILKDIEFSSMCMHHMMPFAGKVHIAYVPSQLICGISKLARTVDYFAARPQVQEKMGEEILDYLVDKLNPLILYVVINSQHSCVGCRGAKSRNSEMVTHHSYRGIPLSSTLNYNRELESFLRGIGQ